jgi:hypothetical protein
VVVRVKTTDFLVHVYPDGSSAPHVYDLIYPQWQARIAQQIGASIAASLMIQALTDDTPPPSPKKIASFACDVAQQLLEEFRARDWLLDLPAPVPPVVPEVVP